MQNNFKKEKKKKEKKSDRYSHSEFQKWVHDIQQNWHRALTYAKFSK